MGDIIWDLDVHFWPRERVLEWWNARWDWDSLQKKQCPHGDYETYADYFTPDATFTDPRTDQSEEERDDALMSSEDSDEPVQTGPQISEADYWGPKRWLTEFPKGSNKRWTPYHLPLFDPVTGALSPKHPGFEGDEKWTEADNLAFARGLKARLRKSKMFEDRWEWERSGGYIRTQSPDRRAQLAGIVTPSDVSFHVSRASVCASFEGALFGAYCRFGSGRSHVLPMSMRFTSYTSFKSASFASNANFMGSQFRGEVSFEDTWFGVSEFDGSLFYRGSSFKSAVFTSYAWFWRVVFGWPADFSRTNFCKEARFEGAGLDSCKFESARFGEDARFDDAALKKTSFKLAKFLGSAGFSAARIDNVDFGEATFFGNADFEGTRFDGGIHFENARFLAAAVFSLGAHASDGEREGSMESIVKRDTENESYVDGLPAIIETNLTLLPELNWAVEGALKKITFEDVEFWQGASFENRRFSERSDFCGAQFYGPPKFHGATLHSDTMWVNTGFWPAPGELPPDPARPHPRTGTCRYDKTARAIGDGYLAADAERRRARAAFDTLRSSKAREWRIAKAKKAFDDANLAYEKTLQAAQEHKLAYEYAIEYSNWRDLKTLRDNWKKAHRLSIRRLSKDKRLPNANKLADEYESAYRRLKILMADIGSRTDEQKFFAFEIQSRIQRRDDEVQAAERWFARLYGVVAGYGRNIWAPLVWLLVLSLMFTGLIAGLSIWAGKGAPVMNLLTYFAKSIPPSFMVREQSIIGTGSVEYQEWLHSVLARHDLIFSSVATVHQLLNLILWFLFALALRRRFQIT